MYLTAVTSDEVSTCFPILNQLREWLSLTGALASLDEAFINSSVIRYRFCPTYSSSLKTFILFHPDKYLNIQSNHK